MKKTTTVMIFFLSASVMAQERTTTSGNEATGAGGTVSYSVGLIDYTSNSGSGGSVSEGVQQPYKISGVGIEEWDMSIDLSIFPNPATEYITVVLPEQMEGLSFNLTDDKGRIVVNGELNTLENSISVSELTPATYYFNVQRSGKNIRTYKITKYN
jgi:hypothetical protein